MAPSSIFDRNRFFILTVGSIIIIKRDTLLPALEHLHSLTHLRLVFHCEAWWRACDYYSEPGPHIAWSTLQDPFLEDLRPSSKFDFTSVASAIVAALPSLRYCFLTSSARVAEMRVIGMYSVVEQWRESRAWRIAPQGEPRADDAAPDTLGKAFELVELHSAVSETIMESEDLVLSAEEEASAIQLNSPAVRSRFSLTFSLYVYPG